MPGYGANSYGGNGHGDQPFTADRSISNTTTTPIPVDLNNQNFKDSTTLSELSRTAEWLDWGKTNLNRLSWDFSTDHLNYGPYVPGPYPPFMLDDYGNPGYIPISGWNSLSVPADYCETLTGDGLGLYPMNLNTGINGTDANLSGKNHSNVKNSYISQGSALDNNELITAVKYSLNDSYDPTVDSPCSKRGSASEPVSLQVVKKPETSDKSNGRAPKLTPISYADVVKFPPGEPDNAIKPEKYYTVSNELVDEVVVEGIMASQDSHTSETGIADVQVTKNDISGCSSMSCHVQKNDPTKDSKFLGKEQVSSLIDTMHNLSDLLLHHCSSETCELREQDLESLEKAVDILYTCMWKDFVRESVSELHQDISIGKHSGCKDDTFSDSDSVESGSDTTTKIDKPDQAINVLIENLHEKEERHQLDLLFKSFSLKVEASCDNLKIKPDNEKDVDEHSISELGGIDKLATEVKDSSISGQSSKDSPVSLPGTACNSDSDDEFDDDDEGEFAADDDEEDEVFYSITLADCSSDWEFVSDEELSGLNSSS